MRDSSLNEPKVSEFDISNEALRSYRGPWKGQLLLACGKCRRRLRPRNVDKDVLKLKKSLKRRSRQDANGVRVRVIEVGCLKMCPEDGVTVCTQAQLGRGECSIVRTAADVDALYAECKRDEIAPRSA